MRSPRCQWRDGCDGSVPYDPATLGSFPSTESFGNFVNSMDHLMATEPSFDLIADADKHPHVQGYRHTTDMELNINRLLAPAESKHRMGTYQNVWTHGNLRISGSCIVQEHPKDVNREADGTNHVQEQVNNVRHIAIFDDVVPSSCRSMGNSHNEDKV